jgi:short-subunit dehydrogenase
MAGQRMGRRETRGSRVLVTGASEGIGRALCLELASQGARVAGLARSAQRLQDLFDVLGASGSEGLPIAGDVTDASVRRAALQQVSAAWGGLDILVNNAGIGAEGPFADADEQRLRRVMEVNFFAATELTRLALPLLRGAGGLVVNVGSVLGHRGMPSVSEYCASKFALRGWSESLRAELAAGGVGVLLASPSTTGTGFFEHQIERKGKARWENRPKTPPEVVARRIVGAIRAGRREVVIGGTGHLLVWASRLAPGLLDAIVRRWA